MANWLRWLHTKYWKMTWWSILPTLRASRKAIRQLSGILKSIRHWPGVDCVRNQAVDWPWMRRDGHVRGKGSGAGRALCPGLWSLSIAEFWRSTALWTFWWGGNEHLCNLLEMRCAWWVQKNIFSVMQSERHFIAHFIKFADALMSHGQQQRRKSELYWGSYPCDLWTGKAKRNGVSLVQWSRSLEIQRVKETAYHCSERSVILAPAQAAIKNPRK